MNNSHINVMLVDDHPLVIAGVRQMLETASDIKVAAHAASAEEAMLQLAAGGIDVALIDISLPDENGMALLQRIKRKWPQVAVVMLSAYSEDAYAIRALRGGAMATSAKALRSTCCSTRCARPHAGGVISAPN